MTGAVVHTGDMRLVLRELDPDSFDSIVCDPPYHLTTGKRGGTGPASLNPASPAGRSRIGTGFMGEAWDGGDIAFQPDTWAACLRVAKPGAHLVAFGGTRTFHRMMCAIEDAGWELRDTLMWVYGSGFAKSENQAGDWKGWGTGLKPAWEPIILARKPFPGTVAENLELHGTGALNVDACRIDAEPMPPNTGAGGIPCRNDVHTPRRPTGSGAAPLKLAGGNPRPFHDGHVPAPSQPHPGGRWPANVCHDGSEEVLAAFPAQAGAQAPVRMRNGDKFKTTYGAFGGSIDEAGSTFRGDTGSAARFFYCPKTSRRDRNEGCEHLASQPLNWSSGDANPGAFQSEGTDRSSPNHHPTVKPTALMRWLVRMVTQPGGLVLDPFTGSGSTGKACVLEGMGFVGVELGQAFGDIARARISWAQRSLL